MATENLLNAETESFGGIIKGDNRFKVPIFQRDYSWSETQWDDLWQDILNGIQSASKHYMGSIVLINKDKKDFEIIDGQQRITTVTVCVLAVVSILRELVEKKIDVEDNQKRIELLTSDFIGKKSLQSLNFSNKLELNEINDPFYATYLIQFRTPPNMRLEKATNKALFKCYEFFRSKVKTEIFINDDVSRLISFVEYISDNLVFIQIVAASDLSAYLIFETLNDRGLDLSVTDLLKNYLFSVVVKDDHKHVKNLWDNIVKSIPYHNFPKFLRHYWMTKNGTILEKDLFKTIKKTINIPERAFSLLEELNANSSIYAALSDPTDSIWSPEPKAREYIAELDLFNVNQCFPLLLVAYQKLQVQDWVKVFRFCSIISFRYIIISNRNPNVLEDVYTRASVKISNGEITKADQVWEILKQVYIDDADFASNFTTRTLKTKRSNKLARYVLYKLENHLSGQNYDFNSDNGTIEHILPEKPETHWDHYFPKEVQENYIYRIGNLTLLEGTTNNNLGGKPFAEKVPDYANSKYRMTKDIVGTNWAPKELQARQEKLAKLAKGIWAINI